MSDFDRKKFVFHETFMNQNGKTSGSGFVGVILGLISGVAFIAAMVGYYFELPNTIEVMGEILKLVAAATILLGIRKVSSDYANTKNVNGNIVIPSTPPAPPVVTDPKKG